MTLPEKITCKAVRLASTARSLRIEASKIEYSALSCTKSRELAKGDLTVLLVKIDKLSGDIKELVKG
jgi:hypothetical protein